MKILIYILAISFPLLAAATGCTRAATYHVTPSGDDMARGDIDHPWRTLEHSLTSLQPGDRLYVHGGVYRERLIHMDIHAGMPDKPILVAPWRDENPVVKGLLWLDRPSYWTIDGINVMWDDDTGKKNEHMVKLTNGVGWTFKNAEISGARSYADLLVAGTISGEPADWCVEGNRIHDARQSNTANEDHLIYVNTGVSAGKGVIEHNILYGAENGEGIKLGGAKSVDGSANVTVRFNTIYGAVQSILVAGRSHDNVIYGNLFGHTKGRYGCIRGYRLTGSGNYAYGNRCLDTQRPILNDRGYEGVEDRGGNEISNDERTLGVLRRLGDRTLDRAKIPVGASDATLTTTGTRP